jgi:hypothetical protein
MAKSLERNLSGICVNTMSLLISTVCNYVFAQVSDTKLAARSKAWFCGLSVAGIAVSNPAGGMDSISCESFALSGKGVC